MPNKTKLAFFAACLILNFAVAALAAPTPTPSRSPWPIPACCLMPAAPSCCFISPPSAHCCEGDSTPTPTRTATATPVRTPTPVPMEDYPVSCRIGFIVPQGKALNAFPLSSHRCTVAVKFSVIPFEFEGYQGVASCAVPANATTCQTTVKMPAPFSYYKPSYQIAPSILTSDELTAVGCIPLQGYPRTGPIVKDQRVVPGVKVDHLYICPVAAK